MEYYLRTKMELEARFTMEEAQSYFHRVARRDAFALDVNYEIDLN